MTNSFYFVIEQTSRRKTRLHQIEHDQKNGSSVRIEQKSSRRTLPLRIEQVKKTGSSSLSTNRAEELEANSSSSNRASGSQRDSLSTSSSSATSSVCSTSRGCASNLFVLGPGNQQHPKEAPSHGERWSWVKVGTFLPPNPPSSSSRSLQSAGRHRTLSTPRDW